MMYSSHCPSTPIDNINVGICVSDTKRGFQRLTEERLEEYPGNITLIEFYIEDLDFENAQVTGDCLEKKEGDIILKQGIFPLPGAIYLQCYVDPKAVKKIEQLIGRKVFNSFIFDKWESWELLKQADNLHTYLPETQKLENNKNLESFLSIYKDVFLKPVDVTQGHSSKGIFRVRCQKNNEIEVTFRKKAKLKRKSFGSYLAFQDWIEPKLSQRYIMQQSIQTLTWEGKVTDIRLNMNRNGQGDWEISLLLLRVASNDSHITQRVKTAVPLTNIIKKFLSDDQNIEEIETAVGNLGFQICKCIDKSGHHMADLGIDLGIDQDGHVWIFEVNPLPRPLSSVLDHSLTLPLEYGSYLASQE